MRIRGAVLVMAMVLPFGPGCASGGGLADRAELSWDAGLATPRDAQEKPVRILRNHQYDMEREEPPPNIYILTRWKQRLPFDDEAASGVEMAQTRFIIEARPRQRNPDGQDLYTVRVRVENQVRTGPSADWTVSPPSDEFRTYANGIAGDIRADLEAGIRVIGSTPAPPAGRWQVGAAAPDRAGRQTVRPMDGPGREG
jgi:hypothetical protein